MVKPGLWPDPDNARRSGPVAVTFRPAIGTPGAMTTHPAVTHRELPRFAVLQDQCVARDDRHHDPYRSALSRVTGPDVLGAQRSHWAQDRLALLGGGPMSRAAAARLPREGRSLGVLIREDGTDACTHDC